MQVGARLLGLVCVGDYGLVRDLSTPLSALMTTDVQTAAEGEAEAGGGKRPRKVRWLMQRSWPRRSRHTESLTVSLVL